MKLKRDEFKAMLKECILELVQEGKIFQGGTTPTSSPGSAVSEQAGNQGSSTGNNKLNEAVQLTARMVAKGDPKKASLYESIIADTARTTLQKQLSAQMTGGELNEGALLPEEKAFDQAQLGAFAAKDRWALVAFGGKGNK